MYSIQQYVIRFDQSLAACRWFSPCTPISSTNKCERHYITELLLKVVSNTIIIPPAYVCFLFLLQDYLVETCPNEYTFIPEICTCVKYHHEQKYHAQATSICQQEGGELVRIDKPIKQLYIERMLGMSIFLWLFIPTYVSHMSK